MDRLTIKTDNDINYLVKRDAGGSYNIIDLVDACEKNTLRKISNKLASYEDTGLDPEEITKVIKSGVPEWIDKYVEYRKLEEQGLLIKLSFKNGDTVYILDDYSDLRDFQSKPLLIPIKCKVTCIIIDEDNKFYYNLVSVDDLFQISDTFDEIPGDDIYSTFEEAEKASE